MFPIAFPISFLFLLKIIYESSLLPNMQVFLIIYIIVYYIAIIAGKLGLRKHRQWLKTKQWVQPNLSHTWRRPSKIKASSLTRSKSESELTSETPLMNPRSYDPTPVFYALFYSSVNPMFLQNEFHTWLNKSYDNLAKSKILSSWVRVAQWAIRA